MEDSPVKFRNFDTMLFKEHHRAALQGVSFLCPKVFRKILNALIKAAEEKYRITDGWGCSARVFVN